MGSGPSVASRGCGSSKISPTLDHHYHVLRLDSLDTTMVLQQVAIDDSHYTTGVSLMKIVAALRYQASALQKSLWFAPSVRKCGPHAPSCICQQRQWLSIIRAPGDDEDSSHELLHIRKSPAIVRNKYPLARVIMSGFVLRGLGLG